MALLKTVIAIFLIVATFNATSFFTHFKNFLSPILKMLRTWIPSVVNLLEETVATIYKYCAESLLEDIKRAIVVLTELVGRVAELFHPAVRSLLEVVTDCLVALHNNGMGYTDEFLQQVLGIDGN